MTRQFVLRNIAEQKRSCCIEDSDAEYCLLGKTRSCLFRRVKYMIFGFHTSCPKKSYVFFFFRTSNIFQIRSLLYNTSIIARILSLGQFGNPLTLILLRLAAYFSSLFPNQSFWPGCQMA